ncbi:MAG: hypothetical protein V7K27_14135 [Nostoc sp.]
MNELLQKEIKASDRTANICNDRRFYQGASHLRKKPCKTSPQPSP